MQGKEANWCSLTQMTFNVRFTCGLSLACCKARRGTCTAIIPACVPIAPSAGTVATPWRALLPQGKAWPERRELSALPDFGFHSAPAGCFVNGGCGPVQKLTGALQAMGGLNGISMLVLGSSILDAPSAAE